MCAAPGSKTAQLIEMLHATETSSMPGNVILVLSIQLHLKYKCLYCFEDRKGISGL